MSTCYCIARRAYHHHSSFILIQAARPIKHTDNRLTDRQTRAKTQENIYKPKSYKQRIDRDKLHHRVLNRVLGKLTKMHNDTLLEAHTAFIHYSKTD